MIKLRKKNMFLETNAKIHQMPGRNGEKLCYLVHAGVSLVSLVKVGTSRRCISLRRRIIVLGGFPAPKD